MASLPVLALAILACGKTSPPPPDEIIRVHAKRWVWDFEYENGLHAADLHVPVGVLVSS